MSNLTVKAILGLAFLILCLALIVPGLDFRFHWPNVPALISMIAYGFVVLGFFIIFLVFRENTYTSAVIEVSDEQRVITSGPYSEEEKYLRANLSGYEEYCQKVRYRLIPYIW